MLLAYDSSKSCEQILLFLIDSPAFKGLDLHIINVTKSPEDVKTSLQLKQAEEKTLTVGFKPVCLSIQGNPETVIDKYIKENNINLLLMGAYGHSRIRHLVIGSTTTQILRSSDIPVLVFR
ncbi:Universal stress protein family [Richelia intracellularis HM01]|uniref:universal stress protein n=1 Tax=Richelia intracellularis TaxID=1164990 RepID=UPI0002B5E3FE|nr:universal stress protein [Richelia intracellularis]CCH65829.1 Universal stress protein family [Richelia intracellularis HM01]